MADGASAVGGSGGSSGSSGGGGTGGTASSPNGGDGTGEGNGGGGGGPSGTGGSSNYDGEYIGADDPGMGGAGGTNGYDAAALPTTASQGTNGGAGQDGAPFQGEFGGGGGVGGDGAIANANGTLTVNVTGGNGNSGGAGYGDEEIEEGAGSGGGGGGGGGGLLFGGTTLTIGGGVTVKGGAGGAGGGGGLGGGSGGGFPGGNGGDGGDGGDGIDFAAVNPNTLVNQGTITGGAGAAGGAGGGAGPGSGMEPGIPGSPGQAGIDGAGVAGENLTITNTGTISGGGTKFTGDAIDFTGGSNTLTPGTGTLNGNIAIDGGVATTLTIKMTGAVTLANAITGTGSLTVSGASASTLTLSGTNTYSGTTTVSAGTLDIQNASALGTTAGGTTVDTGATLKIDGDDLTINEALTLSGTGVGNGGALQDDDTGTTGNVIGGRVTLAAASRIDDDNADGGSIEFDGGITGTNANLTLGGPGAVFIDSAITTGSGTLTWDGTGLLQLLGKDTYTGVTTLKAGTTVAFNGTAIADQDDVVVDAPAILKVLNSETVGSIAGSGSLVLANSTLTTGGGGNTASTTFSGVISDLGSSGGSLTKIGTGTLTLSGANTYTGATTVSGGTLDIQNANALGTTAGGATVGTGATLKIDGDGLTINEPLTLNGGTLDGHDTGTSGNAVTGSLNLTAASQIDSDAGALTIFVNITGAGKGLTLEGAGFTVIDAAIQTGTGTLTKIGSGFTELEGNDTYTGLTKVGAGTLEVYGDNQEFDGGTVEVDTGAELELNDYETVGSIVGGGSIVLYQSTLTTSGGSTPTTFSGVISDDGVSLGSLTKIGAGTQILSGANTYGGTTTVSAGTLDIQNNKALGTTAGGTTVDKGATLKIDGDGLTIAEPLTLAGGTLESSDSVFSGNALTGTVTLTAGSSINSDAGNGGFTVQGIITGSGQALTVGGAGFTAFGGAIQTGTGTLTKTGSGTAALDGTDTYTGQTTVAAGTLYLEDGHAIADTGAVMVDAAATVDVFTSETVGSITGSGTFALSGDTLTISGAVTPTTFSGLIEDYPSSAAGSLSKIGTGTQILSGANTYTGATTISAGTLDIQNNSALGTTAGGTTVDKAATLKIDGDKLSVAEPLTLAGGTLDGHDTGSNGNILTGSVTLTAASQIQSDAGTLTIQGNITGTNQGLTLGGAGGLAISGAIQTGTGTLTKTGGGTAALDGTDTYTGLTTVAAGTLQLNSGHTIADTGAVAVASQGVLSVLKSETVGSIAGDGTIIVANTTFATGDNNTSTMFSGDIVSDSSTGDLKKIGTGTLTLSHANTYAVATTITAGTLDIQNNNALGTTAAGTTVDTGATLKIDGNKLSVAEPLTLAGGTLDSHDTGANGNTLTGSVTLTAASKIQSDAGTFNVQGNITGTGQALTLGGAGGLAISGAIQTGTGTLTKTGSGYVILDGTNTYTGLTTVEAGSLQLYGGHAIGDTSAVVIDTQGDALVATSETVGSIAGSGNIAISGSTLTTGGDNTSTTVSGSLYDYGSNGIGNLTKIGKGTLTLSQADTYSGATTINGGTLALAGSGSLATSAVTLAANTTFDVSGVTSATSVANLTGAGATSVVSLGGKRLTVLKASGSSKVEYVGKTGTEASLVFDVASTSFSLAAATFKSWTADEDSISINGNASANTIVGSSQNDIINGGGGNDTLTGGGGHDVFAFTTALNAATNVDTITDFTTTGASSDTIELAHALFAAAGSTGTLAASAFHIGASATAANQHIIYNSATGGLFYDPDGNGAKAQVEFAKLAPNLTSLANTDFRIV